MKKLTSALIVIALSLTLLTVVAACGGTEQVIKEVPVEREVVVEKEVVKEVPVEKIVERVVVKEVPVEKIVEKEVVKEVVVEKEVVKRVVREVVATAVPLRPGVAAELARYGGQLRAAAPGSIKTLDPSTGSASVTYQIGLHIWDQLYFWSRDFTAAPTLVDKWTASDDFLDYTFTIRDGMTFHDGRPVTTDDVIPSLEQRWAIKPVAKLLYKFAKDEKWIEKVDDLTFVIHMKQPYTDILEGFAPPGVGGIILPKELAAIPTGTDLGEEGIIGQGPYKLAKWVVGDRVVLERHEAYIPRDDPANYLAGARIPYFDELVWLEIPSEETKIAGLKTGEWDLVDDPSLDAYPLLKDYAGIVLGITKPGRISVMIPNHVAAPMDNVKFLKAIQASNDVLTVMSGMGPRELWRLCPSIYFCGHPLETRVGAEFYNMNDKELAKQLLAESGYDGEEIILMNPNDFGTVTPTGLILKPQMEDIGINVSMPGMDWSTLASRAFNLEVLDWHLFTAWHSFPFSINPLVTGFLSEGDYKHYDNPVLADLKETYAAGTDPEERRRLMDEMQQIYYDDVISLNYGQFFGLFPYSERVKNLTVQVYAIYTGAYIEK